MNSATWGLLVLAIVAQSQAETQTDFKCPLPRGSYRHPDDCGAFYECIDGLAELRKCSQGLAFNRATQNCDWPDNTQCLLGPISDNDFYESAFNPIDESEYYEGTDVVCPDKVCDCSVAGPPCSPNYYVCKNKKPTSRKCPDGLVFNGATGVCDYPHNVAECKPTPTPTKPTPTPTKPTKPTPTPTKPTPTSTKPTPTPTKPTPTPTKPTPTPTKPSSTTTHNGICTNFGTGPDPHPNNCSRFCLGGEEMDCPKPLHYHHPSRRCEYPCIAQCDPSVPPCPSSTSTTTTTSKPITVSTTTKKPSVCTNFGTGPDPHPTNCSQFCLGGEEMDCPKPLHYHHPSRRCEYPCIAQCDPSVPPCPSSTAATSKPTTASKPITVSTTTKKPSVCTNWGTGPDPHPTNCAQFCLGGEEMDCPKPLHYHHPSRRCEYPCIAQCDPSVPPCPSSTAATSKPSTTTTSKPITVSTTTKKPSVCTNWGTGPDPHPTNCAQFCLGGEEMDCPKPLHYHHPSRRCEYPCIAQCDPSVPPCPSSTAATSKPSTTTTSKPVTVSTTTKKPSVCTNWGTGPDPHPTNCAQFCLGGEEMDCPKPLHYHHPSRRCEYPCIAQCDPTVPPCPSSTAATSKPSTTTTSKPITVSTTTKKPSVCTNWGTGPDPHPTNCAQFCLGGEEMDCPKPLHYHHPSRRCEYPCIAQCDPTVPPCPSSTAATSKPSTTTTSKPISVSTTTKKPSVCTNWGTGPDPHPTNCAQFCLGGEEMDCPKPLHYHHPSRRCEYPCIAQCDPTVPPCPSSTAATSKPSTTTTSKPITVSTTTKKPSVCTNWGTGPDPHPTNCAQFCLGGEEMDCPKPLHYHHPSRRCEYPCIAQCDPTVPPCPSSTAATSKPSTTTTSKPITGSVSTTTPRPGTPSTVCDKDGLYPHPDCCDKYIHCTNGEAVIKQCCEGLSFNPATQTCDWPENVDCPPKSTISPPTIPPTIDPIGNCSCGCCMIPDTCDCNKFLLCDEKKLYIKKCAEGLVFNPAIETCDFPWNVKNPICPQEVTTYGKAALYTQIHKPDAPICQLEFGLFPDSTNCGRYYHCVNWRPYSKLCPEGLHWNSLFSTCDSPCNARCDKRLNC